MICHLALNWDMCIQGGVRGVGAMTALAESASYRSKRQTGGLVGMSSLYLLRKRNKHTYGGVWYGMVYLGMVWCNMVRYGMVWCGMIWYGVVWYGMVWIGMVEYDMVWIYCSKVW